MFAMLHGPWPARRPGDAVEQRVGDAIRAQVEAGLDLVTDGLAGWPDPSAALEAALERGDTGSDGMLVRAWRAAAGRPEAGAAVVAATVTGPYTMSRRGGGEPGPWDALEIAGRLADELAELEAAGCSMVVVEEPEAVRIGGDEAARRAFREAHAILLGRAPQLHAMLAIAGGSAWEAGATTILEAPYRSYLFDLVAGPDNWYLVRATPGDRGIVCAALRTPSREDQAPLLTWAARYAASANGRGLERVGLANASSLAGLDEEQAVRALRALARAARLAGLDPDAAIAEGLDPRTFSQGPGRGARPRRLRS